MVTKSAGNDRVFDTFNIILMAFIMMLTLYPFYYVVILSFEQKDVFSGFALWPQQFSTAAYRTLFRHNLLWITYRNTVMRSIVGTLFSVFFTAMTAYPLSKRDMPLNGLFTNFILVTMLFSGGLIPIYLQVRNLGLINSFWALIIPSLMGAYNIFIVRNFYRSIPDSLEESAKIDGANWIYIWLRIIIPLSKPVIATIALWILVGHWNSWFDAMIYITDQNKTVVQVILRKIAVERSKTDIAAIMERMSQGDRFPTKTLEAAMITVTLVPMLVIYPFLQKYFVKGIMIGSIKG